MGMVLVVACMFMFAITIEKTEGVCCQHQHGFCHDCTRGIPKCGYGKCNWFGCACRCGCRRSPHGKKCHINFYAPCRCYDYRKKRDTEHEITEDLSPVNVFKKYDFNGDGEKDDKELYKYFHTFYKTALSNEELFETWKELDLNNDNVITIDEIDNDDVKLIFIRFKSP